MQTPIPVPATRLREWRGHLSRLADRITRDPADTRTENLLRLVRNDLRRMERYLRENNP